MIFTTKKFPGCPCFFRSLTLLGPYFHNLMGDERLQSDERCVTSSLPRRRVEIDDQYRVKMKIPYHGLLVSGDVLLAARGCNLHTFSIKDGSHLFTWKYPSLRKDERSDATPARENGSSVPTPMSCDAENPDGEDGDSGPPPKRRKVENSEEVEQEEPDQEMGQEGDEKHPSRRSKRRAKKKKSQALHPIQRPAEPPMIQCLTATTDGKHVVAVTGSDKTIWVFEHDGAGNLVQLSQRQDPDPI